MSRLLEDLERAVGTVGLRQPCLALFARRHGAVAEQPAVALVILAEQVRDKVVAAAVPLAALGADLNFHRVLSLSAPCSSLSAPRAGPGGSNPAAMPSSWALALPHAKLRSGQRWPVPPAGPCLHPGEDGAVAPCANHLRHAIVRSGKAATGHDLGGGATMGTAGEHFSRALAAKDSAALCALLADPIDFPAPTPGRHSQAPPRRPGGRGELL